MDTTMGYRICRDRMAISRGSVAWIKRGFPLISLLATSFLLNAKFSHRRVVRLGSRVIAIEAPPILTPFRRSERLERGRNQRVFRLLDHRALRGPSARELGHDLKRSHWPDKHDGVGNYHLHPFSQHRLVGPYWIHSCNNGVGDGGLQRLSVVLRHGQFYFTGFNDRTCGGRKQYR